jgi:hypothetical protein
MSKAQRSIICATNISELSDRVSRRVRGWAQLHGQVLGVQLDETTQSAGYWALDNGSNYLAVGVGSSILGARADLLLTDDPLRSREESLSDTARANLWDWYHSSARTRLRPNAAESSLPADQQGFWFHLCPRCGTQELPTNQAYVPSEDGGDNHKYHDDRLPETDKQTIESLAVDHELIRRETEAAKRKKRKQ